MIRFARTTPILAVVATAALLADPGRARADFELILQSGSQTQTFFGSGGVLNVTNANINGFSVQFVGGNSNSPGTANLASLDIQAFNVVNNNGSRATLTATLVDTGFTQPNGTGLNVQGLMSGQMKNMSNSSVNLALYAMANNSQIPSGPALMTLSAQATGTDGSEIPINQSDNATFSPAGSTYSLADVLSFTTDAGGSLTSLTGKNHVTPGPSGGPPVVPVPATWLMAITGLPFLGIARYLRRRATV